jgi:hypothetical protein
MSKEIYMVKKSDGSFIAAMESDKEIVDQLKIGQTYRFKVSKPRNYKFLQKFFVLCKIAFDNQEQYNNFDQFRNDLTIESGFYEMRTNYFTGELMPVAKSISFAKMSEFEFKQFFETFIFKICEIYGYDNKYLVEEIDQEVKYIQ